MSKHQELCCGCAYDNIENECYCEECFDCEYIQGDEEPSKYEPDIFARTYELVE